MKKYLILLIVVVSFLAVQTATAEMVTNGGFETGNFSDWTQSGNLDSTSVSVNFPHSGTYAAKLGPLASLGYISQTLTTTPGTSYDLTFWLMNRVNGKRFSVSWDGTTIYDQTNLAAFGYTQYHFTETASANTADLTFGFQHDDFFYLDDVSVNAVPLPGAVWLLGSGLLGLAGLGRRKFRKS